MFFLLKPPCLPSPLRYLDKNIELYTKGVAAVKDRCTADGEEAEEEAPYCETFAEANMKHAINGYMYDNNPYFTMKVAAAPAPLAAGLRWPSPPRARAPVVRSA